MSLVSIQQLRIFSWTEFLESDSRTERVDSRGGVLSFCVHTRQQHNVVTVPSQSELHSWWHSVLNSTLTSHAGLESYQSQTYLPSQRTQHTCDTCLTSHHNRHYRRTNATQANYHNKHPDCNNPPITKSTCTGNASYSVTTRATHLSATTYFHHLQRFFWFCHRTARVTWGPVT